MNDQDGALPWALDQQGHRYDTTFYASTQHQNAAPQTFFSERNLVLAAVPWSWAIALKTRACAAVFHSASRNAAPAGLKQWIMEWPGAGLRDIQGTPQKQRLRQRIQDALNRVSPSGSYSMPMARVTGKTPLYLEMIDLNDALSSAF